jgi:hypothetical protein
MPDDKVRLMSDMTDEMTAELSDQEDVKGHLASADLTSAEVTSADLSSDIEDDDVKGHIGMESITQQDVTDV